VRDGRLQSVRADEATVRVADDGGVTFPTVPLSDVEPVAPSVDEALVAAATTRPLRARLWVAHLVERGQRDDPRVAAWLAHFGD
jgi:hypothetical protein